MIIRTKSGTKYVLDFENGFWSKNDEPKQRMWACKTFRLEDIGDEDLWAFLNRIPGTKTPKIGEHLYVASRDEWYLSTPIVSVDYRGA